MEHDEQTSVGIIGYGRVGSALTASFTAVGIPVSVIETGKVLSNVELPTGAKPIDTDTLPAPTPRGHVAWFLCVPEREAATALDSAVFRQAFRQDLDFVATVSATQDIDELSRRSGVQLGRAHPLHPFPPDSAGQPLPPDIRFAVCRVPKWFLNLLRATGAVPFALDDSLRHLYHGAAVIASNLPAALVILAGQAFAKCGVPHPELQAARMLSHLASIVLDSGATAVPGPAARKDIETVMADQSAINAWNPDAGTVHRILSELLMISTDGTTTIKEKK